MRYQNITIQTGGNIFDAVQFGHGTTDLVMIPGLGDGLMTVKGKALAGEVLYHKYARKYRITIISRKNNLEPGATTCTMAHDQYLAMKALGIDSACILGVSEGGMIAQHLAADYPETVQKLVLVSTVPAADSVIKKNVARWTNYAGKKDFRALMIDMNEKSHSEKVLNRMRWLYPFAGKAAGKPDTERFCIQASACITHDARSKLSRITAPTLIIGGAEDRTLSPEGSRLLARSIPGSWLRICPGQGHALYEDSPEFSSLVLSFLSKGSAL